MVWLGPGPFPGSLPSCFTVTTDRSVWDTAVRSWEAAHPGVVTGPRVSVGDASIVEGNSGTRALRFPVSLSTRPGTGTVTVSWSTAPGTATGGTDFTATKGKLTFTGNQVMKTVSVPVKPDTTDTATEQMYLVLAGVDGGRNSRERGTGTIVDDDAGPAGLVVSDATVVEGDSGARSLLVPIGVSSPPGIDVAVHWSTVPDTALAGSDFVSRSGTAKIRANGTSAMVSIPLVVDGSPEPTESFRVVVSTAPGIPIVDGTGVVTIRDDD
jgi:chitinase